MSHGSSIEDPSLLHFLRLNHLGQSQLRRTRYTYSNAVWDICDSIKQDTMVGKFAGLTSEAHMRVRHIVSISTFYSPRLHTLRLKLKKKRWCAAAHDVERQLPGTSPNPPVRCAAGGCRIDFNEAATASTQNGANISRRILQAHCKPRERRAGRAGVQPGTGDKLGFYTGCIPKPVFKIRQCRTWPTLRPEAVRALPRAKGCV